MKKFVFISNFFVAFSHSDSFMRHTFIYLIVKKNLIPLVSTFPRKLSKSTGSVSRAIIFFFWWREDCSDLGSNHNSWKGVHILRIIQTILMSGRRHKNLNLLSFETQSSLNFILKHIEIGWLGACI